MPLDRLFAPWRGEYVSANSPVGSEGRVCIFCTAPERFGEAGSLVVHVAPRNVVLMNRFPYSSGHVMVAPCRHIASLGEATAEELQEMLALAQRIESVLAQAYKPDGMNMGMNLGRAAGAGFADHIHLHLVPRWIGDANFMTSTAETRVIPEDPAQACLRLRTFFEEGRP
jgi:ATP adenylyltransferase